MAFETALRGAASTVFARGAFEQAESAVPFLSSRERALNRRGALELEHDAALKRRPRGGRMRCCGHVDTVPTRDIREDPREISRDHEQVVRRTALTNAAPFPTNNRLGAEAQRLLKIRL